MLTVAASSQGSATASDKSAQTQLTLRLYLWNLYKYQVVRLHMHRGNLIKKQNCVPSNRFLAYSFPDLTELFKGHLLVIMLGKQLYSTQWKL